MSALTAGKHRAAMPVLMPAPHLIQRERLERGLVVSEHGIVGAIIVTHRTHRTTPAGWAWRVIRGDWSSDGYERTQRLSHAAAIAALISAVDAGEVEE